MQAEDQPRAPFDEQAALEKLEQLKQELEESRQRRKDASAAFDAFVGSFRKEPGKRMEPAPSQVESRVLTRFDAAAGPLVLPKARRKVPIGVVAGGVLAIAAGVVVTRVWRGSPAEPSGPPAAIQTPSAQSPGTAAGGSPIGTPVQATSPGARSELIAVKDVWVRATVDGERVVERELVAGARVPLRGRAITIRAGNAGAVRVVIDGQDRGVLGAEGVVVTRTFTSSAAR